MSDPVLTTNRIAMATDGSIWHCTPTGMVRLDTAAQGVTDGSDAPAGAVGEFQFAARLTSNALLVASGNVRDVLSLDLPPGDWDVQGTVNTSGTAATLNDILIWVSPQSATLPSPDMTAAFAVSELNFGTGGQSGGDIRTQLATGMARASGAGTLRVYLSAAITFTGGTCAVSGAVRARRMR